MHRGLPYTFRGYYLAATLVGIVIILIASLALADGAFGTYFGAHSVDVTYTEINLLTPSSTVSGNLLLANITVNGGNEAVVTQVPYGWTQIRRTDNDVNVSLITYFKIATSSMTETHTWRFQD